MNSLSYLSRQFDVLGSSSTPNTPPSTPSSEKFPTLGGDGDDSARSHPPLKRTRTWSARSFFIPTPAQTQEHQQRLRFPVIRPRKRSGSTPISNFYSLGPSTLSSRTTPSQPPSSSSSAAQTSSDEGKSRVNLLPSAPEQAQASSSLLQAPASNPPAPTHIPKPKTHTPRVSWLRRVHIVRFFLIVAQWFGQLWNGLFSEPQHEENALASAVKLEAEVVTSSLSEKKAANGGGLYTRLRRRKSSILSSQNQPSSFVSLVLQQKRPQPSPLNVADNLPPTVNIIPPEDRLDGFPDQNPDPSQDGHTFPSSSNLSPSSAQRNLGPSVGAAGHNPNMPRSGLHLPKTLVLDLDETLIHSMSRPMFSSSGDGGLLGLGSIFGFGRRGRSGHMVEVVMNGKSTFYHVYKRPFVDYFLRKVSTWYTLVIFTASVQEYADPVIDWLDAGRGILARRLFRDSCTQLPNGTYSKDLTIVEKDLGRVCLIDNSPVCYSINQANGIPIEGWTYDPSDEALLDLLPFLDSLRFTSDVRRVLGLRGF